MIQLSILLKHKYDQLIYVESNNCFSMLSNLKKIKYNTFKLNWK